MIFILTLLLTAQWDFPKAVYQDTYTQARERSINEQLPLVIVFTMEGCQPCKKLCKELNDWKRRDDRIYIEVDRKHFLTSYLKIDTYPSIYVWDNPTQPTEKFIRSFSSQKHTKAFINALVVPP